MFYVAYCETNEGREEKCGDKLVQREYTTINLMPDNDGHRPRDNAANRSAER